MPSKLTVSRAQQTIPAQMQLPTHLVALADRIADRRLSSRAVVLREFCLSGMRQAGLILDDAVPMDDNR